MEVYKAINAVQAALSKTGISKDRQTTGGGASFKFRGIDDVYAAVSPLLAEHKLCIIPRCIARTYVERQTKSGGALFYVTVEAEFDFVSAVDGTKHTARTFGEAMDSGDKATNKAMSAAYKYAAFQTFAIPTEGDNDADAHVHEVAAPAPAERAADWLSAIKSSDDVEALAKVRDDAMKALAKDDDKEAWALVNSASRERKAQLTLKAAA